MHNLFSFWRKRLRQKAYASCIAGLLALLFFAGVVGCDSAETTGPLAEYEGQRALEILKVTQSFTPEVQWLGGRVAAVGVNRGSEPALDSTLIWISTADGNDINSHVEISGETNEAALVESFGGMPADSLESGAQYTFWMAESDVFGAGLDSTSFDGSNFVDTTLTLELVLRGSLIGEGFFGEPPKMESMAIVREETLLGGSYVLTWEPSSVSFRRIAISQASTGSFGNLIWHVVVPETVEEGLVPPIVFGDPPDRAEVAVEFTGFPDSTTYTLWMNTENWDGTFGQTVEGYVSYRISSTNF